MSDRLVTAVEYSKDSRDASPDIVNRLVEDTGERCSKVDPDVVIDPRHAYGYATASGLDLAHAHRRVLRRPGFAHQPG